MKKLLVLFIAITFFASFALVGCGPSSSDTACGKRGSKASTSSCACTGKSCSGTGEAGRTSKSTSTSSREEVGLQQFKGVYPPSWIYPHIMRRWTL